MSSRVRLILLAANPLLSSLGLAACFAFGPQVPDWTPLCKFKSKGQPGLYLRIQKTGHWNGNTDVYLIWTTFRTQPTRWKFSRKLNRVTSRQSNDPPRRKGLFQGTELGFFAKLGNSSPVLFLSSGNCKAWAFVPVLSPELFLNTHSIPYFSLYLVAMCPIGNVITQLFHRVHSLSFLYMPKPYAGPTVSFTKCPPWSRGVLGPRALKYTAFTFNHVYLERNPTCEMLICASVWYPLTTLGPSYKLHSYPHFKV